MKERYRVESMDIFGTCLWHLKDKQGLALLGKQLESINKAAPETWCVVGNYYSVLQDYDSSISFFKKAIDCDASFTYAHTLLGHEYLSNEDLEASAKCFRTAIQTHKRHYNAYYGLGLIEKKQERFPLAEYYFQTSLSISNENPILLDSLASVVEIDPKRCHESLEKYERAIRYSHREQKFIYRLHRAQLLFKLEDYQEVRVILENLIKIGKPESKIYFLYGKTLAKLGLVQEAIVAMTLAQDYLEHKSSSIIKDAIGNFLLIRKIVYRC
jgi:anaphase-promoting complex subunit 3